MELSVYILLDCLWVFFLCHDFPYLSMAASTLLLLHTHVVDINIQLPHLCQLYNYSDWTASLPLHVSWLRLRCLIVTSRLGYAFPYIKTPFQRRRALSLFSCIFRLNNSCTTQSFHLSATGVLLDLASERLRWWSCPIGLTVGQKTVPMMGCFMLLAVTSILIQITWLWVHCKAKMLYYHIYYF